MKRLFEFRVFDVMKDDNNREFLNKVKDESPDLYDRFMSLVGNKGLEIAKQKYIEFDPVEVEKREKQRKKDERRRKSEEVKEKRIKRFLRIYGGAVNNIHDYLRKSPLKGVINNIREEKNLTKWKKKYTTLFKGRESSAYELTSKAIDSVEIIPPGYKKFNQEFGDSRSIKIEQFIRVLNDNKDIESVEFTVRFKFDPYGFDDFIIDQQLAIEGLNTYKYLSLEELNKLLEKFKYYMSDKYKDDWKIEKEAEKYNL